MFVAQPGIVSHTQRLLSDAMNHIIISLLPVVFMLHDFEEMIVLPTWTRRHGADIVRRYPSFAPRLAFMQSREPFAMAVLEEFVLLSAATVATLATGQIVWWYVMLAGFALHLPVHWAQCLLWRGYVPGALTTVPAALYCVWAFVSCAGSLSPALSVALALAGLAVMAVNLWLIHKLMPRLWRLTGGDGE